MFNNKANLKWSLNKEGFSVLGAMIAAALLMAGVMAFLTTTTSLLKGGVRNRLIGRQIEIETAILSEIKNRDNFRALWNGGSPSGLTLSSEGIRVAQVGTPVFIDLDQWQNCSTFGSGSCLLQVDFSIQCNADPNASDIRACTAAYRISATGRQSEAINLAPVGAKGARGAAFDSSKDFKTIIPYTYFDGKQIATSCLPDLAMTGYDRDTGRPNCIGAPDNPCGPGMVAQSITFDAASRSLKMNCVNANRKLGCPVNYALLNVNSASLTSGSTVSGTCVFIGADTTGQWPNLPPISRNPSGTFCPKHYTPRPQCSVLNEQQSGPAWCNDCTHQECASGHNERRDVVWNGVVVWSYDVWVCDQWRTIIDIAAHWINPQRGGCGTSVSGQSASAFLNSPQPSCPCGGGSVWWVADIKMWGDCALAEPAQIPATEVF